MAASRCRPATARCGHYRSHSAVGSLVWPPIGKIRLLDGRTWPSEAGLGYAAEADPLSLAADALAPWRPPLPCRGLLYPTPPLPRCAAPACVASSTLLPPLPQRMPLLLAPPPTRYGRPRFGMVMGERGGGATSAREGGSGGEEAAAGQGQ